MGRLTWVLLLVATASTASEVGYATYYTEQSCKAEGTSGVWTANGERFDEKALTCAMRSRKWGSTFKVTNLDNGKSVVVRLNDFGPGKKATSRGVIVDLTPAGFSALGASPKAGRLRVRVEVVKAK